MAMLSFEKEYRVRGGTLIGGDLFDFWAGPFCVGFFGVTTLPSSRSIGTALDCLWLRPMGRTWNLWQINIAPPDLSYGLGACAALKARWSLAIHHASARPGAFVCVGAARGRDLPQAGHRACVCRWPSASPSVAYVTLEGDPAASCSAAGATAFPYGIISRISDWVSNVGYQYLHFHYNPGPHDRGARCSSQRRTGARAAWRHSCFRPPTRRKDELVKTAEHENSFFRDTHRLLDRHAGHPPPRSVPRRCGAVFFSAVCIVISGPFWTQRLARMVELVARPADLVVSREDIAS